MRLKRLGIVAASAAVLWSAIGSAAPLTVNKEVILAEHNKYRAEVGVPPLTWSNKLAEGAQRWADTIAALDQMKHSQTSGVGENLAFWSGSNPTLTTMIGMWEKEKELFTPGTFPNVSRDGKWLSVSHYTQMVWRKTTQVGCGVGHGKSDFLVCWYSPQGNFIGDAPY
ncbi:MAG: hypothetical protein JO208_09570 [Alphaproteobacteria bacterium]|nr:hypothetical protein [Alphaproteobacteria bacterium]